MSGADVLDPQSDDLSLGTSLASKGGFKEALIAFEDALRIRPNDAQTRQNLSTARQLLDRQR